MTTDRTTPTLLPTMTSDHDHDHDLWQSVTTTLLGEMLVEAAGLPASGGRYPCPHHAGQTGRTPPVAVWHSGGRARYWCHACETGGDAVHLLHRGPAGMPLADAFAALRQRVGLPERRTRRQTPRPQQQRPQVGAEIAAVTLAGPEGDDHPLPCAVRSEHAADRLLGRGSSQPEIAAWAHARGITDEAVDAAGLVLVERRWRQEWVPAVRIPRLDSQGRLAGAQDRPLAPGPPPKWNTRSVRSRLPAGVSASLRSFGADRLLSESQAVLCEGPTDMLAALSCYGPDAPVFAADSKGSLPAVAEAVAAEGLARWLVVLADGDTAGLLAAAAARSAWARHLPAADCSVLRPAPGEDIGSLVTAHGAPSILRALLRAEEDASIHPDGTALIFHPTND